MRKRSAVHATRGVTTGRRPAGGKRRARSASTAARIRGFEGTACAELGGGGCGGLARQVAMSQMLINVATRKFARSVRLPEGDVPAPAGAGLSKSAAFRRFLALSGARMKEWMPLSSGNRSSRHSASARWSRSLRERISCNQADHGVRPLRGSVFPCFHEVRARRSARENACGALVERAPGGRITGTMAREATEIEARERRWSPDM